MTDTKIMELFNDQPTGMRTKIAWVYGLLIVGNVAAWSWALAVFHKSPILFAAACLAYTFGLRHGFDADHIVAIDNVTRKLMQGGKRPIAAGLFFALGHSTVVIGLTMFIAVTTRALAASAFGHQDIDRVIGTCISVLFLFGIAAANTLVLIQVYRSFRLARHGHSIDGDLEGILVQRGFYGRIFRGLFRLIGRSWHMYMLGLLFGIGFDTATEIGLLGIAASEASHGLSISSILVFPALFTAGIALVDTTDGIVMLGTYGWAFMHPVRKLSTTSPSLFLSVFTALLVAGIEAVGLARDYLGLKGSLGRVVATLDNHLGVLGYMIVALFMTSWSISFLIYRAKGYRRLDTQN